MGFRYMVNSWNDHVVAFNGKGNNIIDWVKREDELIWESSNIIRLNTYGIEFEIKWKRPEALHFPIKEIRMGYAFLDNYRQSEEHISAYVLDHLKHKFVSGIVLPLHKLAEIAIMVVYQNRAGTYKEFSSGSEVGYDPFLLVDMGGLCEALHKFPCGVPSVRLLVTPQTIIPDCRYRRISL